MSRSLSDVVTEVSELVLSGMREETDQLGSSVAAGATSLSLAAGDTLGSIIANALLQVDWELFFVTSTPVNTSAIPVVPGFYSSTTITHAANALLTVNPRFPVVSIVRAVNEELDDLSAPTNGLYTPAEMTMTFNPAIIGYDFTDALTGLAIPDPTAFIDFTAVRVHDYGPWQAWPIVPLSEVHLIRQALPSVFPSGLGLQFKGMGYPGREIRVQYKQAYTHVALPTDDLLTVAGMHTQAQDIPALGAAVRLMSYRELKRSFTEAQPEPRRPQEVPVGSSLTAMKGLLQLRMNRIAAERTRLNGMYGGGTSSR